MARKLRDDVAGAIHHVYARGNAKMPIFLDDRDRQMFLQILAGVIRRTGWRCLSYCLLDNHFHLLIETPEANLADGMRRLTGDYARYFNDRYKRSGHVFQGRYGSKRVKSDGQLLMVIAYIAENPVEAGLCERPDEWPWCSRGALARGRPPAWLDRTRLLELGQMSQLCT